MLKIKPDVFNSMRTYVQDVVEAYQTDFAIDVYHLLTTSDTAKAYVWLCRPYGTNLYPLPLNEASKYALEFYIWEQGDKIKIFRLTAKELKPLTIEQAKEVIYR